MNSQTSAEAPDFVHRTVMLRETLDAIAPRPGGIYADATAGGGGHTLGLLEQSAPDGRVIAVDRDPRAVECTGVRLATFGRRASVVHARFSELGDVLAEAGAPQVDGLIADLGVSSPQLDEASRGFSFAQEGPLDMRMDPSHGESLRELLSRVDAEELADILYHYGEERRSRPIARSILAALAEGELETTADLRRAVLRAAGGRSKGRARIDPATRSFQALRIAVNRELEELEALLDQLPELLCDDGVAVIISFHSLEDRMVKRRFRDDARLAVLTKRPLRATDREVEQNPRARSAKLRAARRRPRPAAAQTPAEAGGRP